MEKIEKLTQFMVSRGVTITRKEDSALMKVISTLLFFAKGFMTDFTTTIGNHIYVPDSMKDNLEVLCHEFVHIDDARVEGSCWYSFKYLVPQVFALLSLGALAAIWCGPYYLFFLVALIFLAPWRAKYRRLQELRAYKMSVAVAAWEGLEVNIDYIVKQYFRGGAYYWMGDKDVRQVLSASYALAKQGRPLGRPYDTIYCLLFSQCAKECRCTEMVN